MREAVGLEALHAATLVVHANQQVFAHFFDLGAQGAELSAVFPVAGKQDQPACQRMLEALAVGLGQREAGDVDDEGGVLAGGGVHKNT